MLNCCRIRSWALLGLLSAALVFTGCGKKGDPIPPRLSLPPAIADLKASAVAEGVSLGWSASGPVQRVDHFRIARSETAAAQACPGCPQEYRILDRLKLSEPRLKRSGEREFGFLDASVRDGYYYSYQVSACDSRGYCAEASVPAGLFK